MVMITLANQNINVKKAILNRPSLIVFQVRNYYISTDATQETGNVPFENNDISSYICDFRQNKTKIRYII